MFDVVKKYFLTNRSIAFFWLVSCAWCASINNDSDLKRYGSELCPDLSGKYHLIGLSVDGINGVDVKYEKIAAIYSLGFSDDGSGFDGVFRVLIKENSTGSDNRPPRYPRWDERVNGSVSESATFEMIKASESLYKVNYFLPGGKLVGGYFISPSSGVSVCHGGSYYHEGVMPEASAVADGFFTKNYGVVFSGLKLDEKGNLVVFRGMSLRVGALGGLLSSSKNVHETVTTFKRVQY